MLAGNVETNGTKPSASTGDAVLEDVDRPEGRLAVRTESSLEWLREVLADADVKLGGDRPWDIRTYDPSIADRLLAQGTLGFGDAYVDGLWECDALDVFFQKVLEARLETRIKPNFQLLVQIAKAKLLNMQNRARSLRVAEIHYNLSNAFYEAMLDPWMQYTCAYYGSGATTLEEAQEAKLDLVCRKLDIRPGDRVLELGCGWGGFARWAATKRGAEVVAYNISTEQVAWARERCAGLPVDIRLSDYRDAEGEFDKVVSIGMCEHVGPKNYRTLMETAHRCLKPGGLFLLHTIGGNREVPSNDAWIDAHIFPGAVLPSPTGLSRAYDGLFVLEDWHNIGPDYDRTLMAWYERFEAAWPRFEAQYGEPFHRMWRYYLLMCVGSFRSRKNQLWQLLLSKGGIPGGWPTVR